MWKRNRHGVSVLSGFSHQYNQHERAQRQKKRLRITPRFWIVMLGVLVLYVGSAYVIGFVKIARIGAQIRMAEEELTSIQTENEIFREQLVYMQSDEYVEEVARTELGLVKPGETAVVVVKTDAEEDPVARERLADPEEPIPPY